MSVYDGRSHLQNVLKHADEFIGAFVKKSFIKRLIKGNSTVCLK